MIRSILNVKGGVGKTTTAVQLAAGFSKSGRKTLLIDADGQANATALLLPDYDYSSPSIVEALKGARPASDCIYPTRFENLYAMPARLDLFSTIYEIQSTSVTGFPQLVMKKMLKPLDFEEIIIDNNPSINLMSINSILSARQIIIPTNIDAGGLAGVKATWDHCRSVMDSLDKEEPLDMRILITMVNRNNTDRDIIRQLRKLYENRVFTAQIRYQSAPVKRSTFSGGLLIDDNKSGVAEDYRTLIDEVLKEDN
jgi:chromosome partitioning protein